MCHGSVRLFQHGSNLTYGSSYFLKPLIGFDRIPFLQCFNDSGEYHSIVAVPEPWSEYLQKDQ